MLTRRDFAGFASCALCAVTGFIATDASAQTTAPAATPGVTRKILSQTDGPTPGYVTIIVEAEIEAGVNSAEIDAVHEELFTIGARLGKPLIAGVHGAALGGGTVQIDFYPPYL